MVHSPHLLQTVVNSPQYPTFLADAMKVFLKILEDGEPQFIAEQNMQVSVGVVGGRGDWWVCVVF